MSTPYDDSQPTNGSPQATNDPPPFAWQVTKDDRVDTQRVPSGVSEVVIKNRSSSDFGVNYYHNGSNLGHVGAGAQTSPFDVAPGDTVSMRLDVQNPPGRRAHGSYNFS